MADERVESPVLSSSSAEQILNLGGERRGGGRATPYERLKNAILDGELAPGAPLIEVEVARWAGVSRTPVREALTRLEQDGLIERTERGLLVKTRSPEEILDIYEVRVVLESLAARYAAERRTRMDQLRMEKLLAEAPEAAPEEFVAHNQEFHRAVWSASHNEAIIGLLDRLASHLTRYPATTLTYPGRWEDAQEEHRQLVQAIVARDADAAAAVATTHFQRARDIRLELYEQEIV